MLVVTKLAAPRSLEATINLHKRVISSAFKKKAPRAVRAIRKFAQQNLSTRIVKVDAGLNQYLYHKGVRNVPFRVRVELHRKPNPKFNAEKDEAWKKFYTLVKLKEVDTFRGLQTKVLDVEAADE